MAILKTEAIVLKTYDFRETSLIGHFFTKGYGRIDGILKGIRKDPRKFGSTLEPFSVNEIIFYQKRNSSLHLVSQCDLIQNFNHIRTCLKSIAFASYLADLLRHLMPQEERNEQVYELALYAFTQINQGSEVEKVLRIFIIKCLKIIGFRPRLDGCISCNKSIFEAAYFNVKKGGLLCSRCALANPSSSDVLKGTIASIVHLENNTWENALRLSLNGKMKEELNHILDNFIEFHLQIKPKSKEFLEILA